MSKIFAKIKGVYYRIIRREWITAKDCEPVPVYLVEDARVFILARTIRVVEDEEND
jgi:hypothetical protein